MHKAHTFVLGPSKECSFGTYAGFSYSSIFDLIKTDCNKSFLFSLFQPLGQSNVGRKDIYLDLVYRWRERNDISMIKSIRVEYYLYLP